MSKSHVALRAKAEELRVEALNELNGLPENATDEQRASVQAKVDKVQEMFARADQIQSLENFATPVADDSEPAPKLEGSTPVVTQSDPYIRVLYSPLKAFKHSDSGRKDAYRSGQFLRAVCFGDEKAREWCIGHGLQGALSGGDNAKGGALIPEELSNVIIDLREQYGVFRRECRVMPMGSDTMLVPRRVGGLTAYYVGDNTEITASDKTWDQVSLVAKKLGVLVKYSSEVAEDAIINLADDLANEIAYAFSEAEDGAGFIGDGTSTYGGIHGVAVKVNDGNHAGSIKTAATGNTAFSTLDLADFHGVVAKLPLYARRNAKWYISAAGFAESMERLAYAAGGNTTMNIGGGMGLSFLGYPVVLSQKLNSTLTADTNAIKCLFGDLRSAAMMGTRRDVRIAVSDDRYFELDQIGIKGTQRFDINVHDLGGASTAGPIVALKTPGS